MEKQKPGIKRACDYITKMTQHLGDSPLPPIRSLAKSAEVSFVTMWKALKILQENGTLISDTQGNRLTFASSGSDNPLKKKDLPQESDFTRDKVLTGSRYVSEKLYKDIVTGRFTGSDRLPSCKELQRIYGVSFATLKKSLASLVEQQIIEPRTNGYYIPSLTGNTGHSRLVVVSCGWEDGKIWVDYQDKNYFRALESECIRMNIQLDVVVYYRNKSRLRFVHNASSKDYDLTDRSILGYIFIVANLDSTPEEVLEKLSRLKRNVAVLDVVGGWKIPRCAQNERNIQFFTATASVIPAKRVAQYLLLKGHQRIAFFSPFHRALWSQRRFETITEMFNLAGITNGVTPFVYNNYAFQWDYLRNHTHQEDLRSIIQKYNEWKKEAQGTYLKRLGNIGYSIVKYMTEWNCASGEIYEKMKPLFDKALDKREITAWVMANDFTATIAIDYLKERNIRVPDDISIISFDNTLDAMEYQLTSYDFNNQGLVSMIMRFILAPNTIKPVKKGDCIEVDGSLVVRRSG
jgi:DNA-binding LacI/PurR family transcriptional regulator/DNA-binding transcriptional regulator YhcF (GntR family)